MILALEIHDAGLVAVSDVGAIDSPPSPGFAVLDGGKLLVGRAAAARARLVPRRVHRRFWAELDDAPLPGPWDGMSTADLVYAHLQALRGELPDGVEAVLLTLPGHFSERQLALLLGVARAAGLAVDGLVDQALAAALAGEALAGDVPARRLVHLELYLDQLVLSELEHDGDALIRRRVMARPEIGWSQLHDAWARRIAELSVRAMRFDPLSSATAEQALYDRLPAWLAELAGRPRVKIELASPGRQRELELGADEVIRVAAPFYDALRDLTRTRLQDGTSVLVSSRLAGLPGLLEHLATLGTDVVALPENAAACGALRHQDAIRRPGDEILPLITRLPAPPLPPSLSLVSSSAPSEVEEPAAADRGVPPTHLLCDDVAFPIGDEPLWLAGEDGAPVLATTGTTGVCSVYRQQGEVVVEARGDGGVALNGRPLVGRARLESGDRLELTGGVEMRLIRVVPPEVVDGAKAT